MFRAKFFIATGWGLDTKIVSANSYKELVEKINIATKLITNTKCKLAKNNECLTIEKIIYFYPSGKTFVQRVAN